jgi:hypothetical protein
MSRIDRMYIFSDIYLFWKNISIFNISFSSTCICCALFRVIARFFYLKLSSYCVSFRVFIFFYESIYLGGGFKGSFFSSLSASML